MAFIAMLYGDQILSTGSCFFWELNGRTYLLTNWHNLSGRNPLTNEPMSKTGGLPDRVSFMMYKKISEPDADGYFELAYLPVEVKLCDPDLSNPKWVEHPEFGRSVDVGALDVTDAAAGFEIRHVNALESDAVLAPWASQDVFVVGFPFGLITGAPAPIWKRGTVAMDPTFDADGLPKMLIDTATREGMSGSVVVARHIIVGRDYPKKNGTKSQSVLYAQLDVVVGIYSGRHYPDFEKAQLGIVWKRRVIDEVLQGQRAASV